MRGRRIACWAAALLVAGASSRAAAQSQPAGGAALKTFETQVRPILAERCFKCHGERHQRNGLRLDSRQGMLAGGDLGPAIVPGKVNESLLIEAINHQSLEMPPDGKLSDEEIAILTRWIRLGAPWPAQQPTRAEDEAAELITDADRAYWAFQPIGRPAVPLVDDRGWSRGQIDRFIFAKLRDIGLSPAPQADRRTLIRRVFYDLLGLPPTADQVEAFLQDDSPTAYDDLVDRLLASPHYGERWARHWLDLARYAESDGHGNDAYRPEAWRYRDYVIRSFNEDQPYDAFVREQLAGDQLAPHDPDAIVATGFLRHWIYENNQRKVREVREIILNDVTDVTGELFMGLSFGCARCHNHKFDPILQEDYYRLQAFFAPLVPRDDVPAATAEQLRDYQTRLAAWEEKTAEIRARIARLEAPARQASAERAFKMFPQDIKDLYRKPRSENSPLELQLVALVDRQLDAGDNVGRKLEGDAKEKWDRLQRQLAEFDDLKPRPLPTPMTVLDVGRQAPPTTPPGRDEPIEPGFPVVLGGAAAQAQPTADAPDSTGRRAALAWWLTSSENPLTARVMANRVWQYHFGRGLVSTSSDFGRLGESPSHPELLDYLAAEFSRRQWSLKWLHKAIVTSATYRQCSVFEGAAAVEEQDPDNRYLARMPIRRLDAEQLRDTVLAATGELDAAVGGQSVEDDSPRRSIYRQVLRNQPDQLMQAFDAPDGFNSEPHRPVTTTAPQALALLNGDWAIERAGLLAKRVTARGDGDDASIVKRLYRLLFSRAPDELEQTAAVEFLRRRTAAAREDADGAVVDLAHVLLNANELIYVD